MLTATQTQTVFFSHSSGNDLTVLELQNRKDGRRVDLKIWSRLPLSMAEVRTAIATALDCDKWEWRQLNCFAEYVPF